MGNSVVIFANDPGEVNSAFSIVRFKKMKAKILETGMITETIVNLTDSERKTTKKARHVEPKLADSLNRFMRRMSSLMTTHKPDCYISERFQSRGVKSRSIETVSTMNALAISIAKSKGATFRLVMAADWKNWINRITPLDKLYTIGNGLGISNHTIDTVLIAFYQYWNRYLCRTDKPTASDLKDLIKQVANTFEKKIGVRSKVKVKWSDGKQYAAVVEKVMAKRAVVRFYEDNSTATVPISDLIAWT